MTKKEQITVSIFCLTYNHKDYIRDAIEGFLSQQTNFNYNIYIYDDASTDGTSDIVREYAKKFPELITAHICQENTFHMPGIGKKHAEIRASLSGKYIALCEGDDYWIDSHKLQRQVDYMEQHEECSMLMHNSIWWNYDDMSVRAANPFYTDVGYKELTPREIIMQEHGNPATASFLYRKDMMPDFFYESSVGDYPLQLYMLTKGKVVYDSRIMSVYRFHTPGSYNVMTTADENHKVFFYMGLITFLLKYDEYTMNKEHVTISDRLQRLISVFFENIDGDKSLQDYINQGVAIGKINFEISSELIIKLEKLRKQIYDLDYYSEDVHRYCASHVTIGVMGTGKFAAIISEQLERNGQGIEGYCVSKYNTEQNLFRGKKVVALRELADKNAGIIVAINPIDREDIKNSLETAGIKDYFNPFVFLN